jgi:hypothetical protein
MDQLWYQLHEKPDLWWSASASISTALIALQICSKFNISFPPCGTYWLAPEASVATVAILVAIYVAILMSIGLGYACWFWPLVVVTRNHFNFRTSWLHRTRIYVLLRASLISN